MTRNNTKKRQKRGKNEPRLIKGIIDGLADNPEFILYNILKAKKA